MTTEEKSQVRGLGRWKRWLLGERELVGRALLKEDCRGFWKAR